MTAEVVEGTAVEVEPVRAVVVAQPGQALVASEADPAGMVAVATRLADVLADIVEKKRLYATIRGKRYPTVEAWMTIARLDNVVAREPQPPVRHEDGTWEAFAELVRLSDGMVIGASSALCGDPQDQPWDTRADYQRRAMAQTRATSRAFRQQYSWIMALAGYQPTPAEEMPRDDDEPAPDLERDTDGSIVGTIDAKDIEAARKGGKRSADYELRLTPDGAALGFRLKSGRKSILVETTGRLAEDMAEQHERVIGQRVTVWGTVADRSFTKGDREQAYQVVVAARIRVPEVGDLPVAVEPAGPEVTEAESEAIWRSLEELQA